MLTSFAHSAALASPFAHDFMLRALLAGLIVSLLCAVVGTWVVIRGLAFLGEAVAHGMLPGVAIATLLGAPAALGGAVAAAAMAVGVSMTARRAKVQQDTAIGLLFVGMLALGVIIVSASRSFAVDLTAILFGDILAVTWPDLVALSAVAVLGLGVCGVLHRPFVALAFDERIAHALRMRPALAHYGLLAVVTLAVVASYQAVGTLLVVGFLIAPPATAALWVHRIPVMMAVAALLAAGATVIGLLISWYAGTAAGASIAATAVGVFFLALVVRRVASRRTVASRG